MSDRVLNNLYQAETAVEQLTKMGIEVARCEVSESRPKLMLRGRDEELRAKFGGGIHVIRPAANGGRQVTMVATFEGCQLQWGYEL